MLGGYDFISSRALSKFFIINGILDILVSFYCWERNSLKN